LGVGVDWIEAVQGRGLVAGCFENGNAVITFGFHERWEIS
jgi:hypothetical protein